MQPGDSNTLVCVESFNISAELYDASNDLMSRNYVGTAYGKITFDYVQIGATDATGRNANEDLVVFWNRSWHILELDRMVFSGRRRFESPRFHVTQLQSSDEKPSQ
jgi:hypothetical protein